VALVFDVVSKRGYVYGRLTVAIKLIVSKRQTLHYSCDAYSDLLFSNVQRKLKYSKQICERLKTIFFYNRQKNATFMHRYQVAKDVIF
jgi:hypothetical protein